MCKFRPSRKMKYLEIVDTLFEEIKNRKEDKVLVVSLEGIGNSGKSTLAKHLADKLKKDGHDPLIVEGDLFHVGRDQAHASYQETIKLLDSHLLEKCNFHQILTWKLKELESQLLSEITLFNQTEEIEKTIKLHNVLSEKNSGTEHDEEIKINKKTILLLPGVFLRHLQGIDFSIYLEVDPTNSTQRKMERNLKLNLGRSFDFTKAIGERLEYPTLLEFNQKVRKPDIIINTDNWDDLTIQKYLKQS